MWSWKDLDWKNRRHCNGFDVKGFNPELTVLFQSENNNQKRAMVPIS